MKWKKLIRNISELNNPFFPDKKEIKGITDNSREVGEGYVFVAVEGFSVDGHDYIKEAVEKGAAVVIGQQSINKINRPYIKVENSRKILGQLAASFYGYPSKNKVVIGVTGTNRKTTTGLFLRHLLKRKGYSVSFFGTVFNEINGEETKSQTTTPSSLMIQKSLAESDDQVAVIEVSSQGLSQYRMEGMSFDYALFTNLQHDHLDYHQSMEDYFQAKKELFSLLKVSGTAVVNEVDEWGRRLSKLLREEDKRVITVGEDDQNVVYHMKNNGHGVCVMENNTYEIELPLPGKYNLANLALGLTVLNDMQHDLSGISNIMRGIGPLPGRFETYDLSNKVYGIVDYAHTTEALQALFTTIRESHGDYRIIHIFGFRGQRDSTKRDKMVDISRSYCDETILTLDDLNGVSVDIMKAEYEKQQQRYSEATIKVILDRTRAIEKTVNTASQKTLIVVSGKGHENYQQAFELSSTSDKETFELLSIKTANI
ncbi:UDP-N-acetylmuramoyl-L-alanyl-D-glutamate--2,6-diaminopimelate ligase [Alkalibacterium kapii]|uniref:UDP-N-acetylmuramoyl-L-alanyl-D-glutamate--2,6-diaminopimelate ligase n=1 Tax=Alkalibacterium kapii TaxID=426704 RepID=A0A511ASW2_9LACT|nr:UDP-N-acetylmuramoyl-L-alanyl-D-glutamate--2,6-diaminopimelate ligase [Alkalibacterium kapii]GEK91290.1 UDP-N-acetylmuramoyl-L-alanyl-D-glutamate--2,6-diaminopimelate ligase [Alkalibacterium kapii]